MPGMTFLIVTGNTTIVPKFLKDFNPPKPAKASEDSLPLLYFA
jgi:hypothetical protein